MDRREIIGLGLLGGLLGLSAKGQGQETSSGSKFANLSVTITLNGASYVYSMAGGKDLGLFKGPGFQQRNIQAKHPIPDIPAFEVYFRPDVAPGSRGEVVFELGKCWGPANKAAYHLLPNENGIAYHVEIKDGDTVVAHGDVPKHWWFARWRWQSGQREIVNTPSDLVAKKLVPLYGNTGVNIPALKSSQYVYAVMGSAGVVTAMGSTGDRADIGLLTEISANWLLNPTNTNAELAMRAWGEAAGSIPIHYRDEQTGAPVSSITYPKLSTYYQPQGASWFRSWTTIRNEKGSVVGDWGPDAAHYPALSYIPAVATGDPYFLENMQFDAVQVMAETAYGNDTNAYVNPGQTRTYAWGMRTLFMAARATQLAEENGTLPSWLLPFSYYKTLMANQLTRFNNWVHNPTPCGRVFCGATAINSSEVWEEEFLAQALGFAVLVGFSDWLAAYKWKLGSTIARTNGKSGWPRAFCTPYWLTYGPDLREGPYYPADPAAGRSDQYYQSWGELWKGFALKLLGNQISAETVAALAADPENGGVWAQSNGPDYLIYTRGVLALAVYNGIGEAVEPLSFLDKMVAKKGYMTARWSVMPKKSA